MRYRRLGRYGVRVSEVGLGGWLTQGRTLEDATTAQIVKRAFDLGVNFFDTADQYGNGGAERALGMAITGIPRQDLVIGTKCYFPMSDRPNDRGLSRKHILESVNGSLERLGTDYIDLMQFHRFDPETPLDESIRAIEDVIRQGKVLYWGVSEWTAEQIGDAVAFSDRLLCNPPVSNQPRYSMLQRGIEETVMPACAKLGLGLVVFSPLAQGVLTGKYRPGEPPPHGSRGSDESSNRFMKNWLNDETLGRVQRLAAFAHELGYPLEHLALAWCLRKTEVNSVIVGATSIPQIESNVAGSGIELSDDVWAQAEAILEGNA